MVRQGEGAGRGRDFEFGDQKPDGASPRAFRISDLVTGYQLRLNTYPSQWYHLGGTDPKGG